MTGSNPVTAVDASVSRGTGDVQMLVFLIGHEEFAIPLTEIQEIMKTMPLTPVPHAQPAVRGIVNVRGKIATAISLATILGFETDAAAEHMIMAESGKNLYALLVGGVSGVLRTSVDHLHSTPEIFASKPSAAFLNGALVIPALNEKGEELDPGLGDSRIILILHLPTVLAAVTATSVR